MTTDEAGPPANSAGPVESAQTSGSDSELISPAVPTRTAGTVNAPVAAPQSDDRIPAPLQPRDPARYQILAEHGRGGLGRVYRARDKELGRDVALKELLQPTYRSELRFFREALITARLEHPGIVPVHEAGRWPDGTPFYSMKLVAGRALSELLAEAKTLDQRLALLPHLIAVADAIAYAHDRKIIHRDLKPSNVIIGEFGETIVIDWGLAKDLSEASNDDDTGAPYRASAAPDVTVAGSILGTPAYMSPEQARGDPADTSSDVYSLGAMLFQLCTGAAPHTDSRPRDLRAQLRGTREDLATIVIKSLSAAPSGRYGTASAFANDLRAYDAGARILAREYSLAAMLGHWIRHHTRIAISIAIPTAVAMVIGILSLREIVLQRDRAAAAQHLAEGARDDLTLKTAELLMKSDPTAAAGTLDRYRGTDSFTQDLLRAEAFGRGVARLVAKPHSDTVFFLRVVDGAVLSASTDQLIVRTTSKGSQILARDFGYSPVIAYAPNSRVLVYARHPDGLAILRLHTGKSEVRHPGLAVSAVAISPDERTIVTIAQSGALALESMDAAQGKAGQSITTVPGARRAAFVTADTLVVLKRDAIMSVDLSNPLGPQSYTVMANELATELAIRDNKAAIGSTDGSVHIIDVASMKPTRVVAACEGAVNSVKFVPRRQLLAFACQAGTVGLIDLSTGTPAMSFSTETAAYALAATSDGRFLLAGGRSSVVYVYDLETSIITRYLGHPATISVLAASADASAPLVSADVNGTIRRWSLPPDEFWPVFRGPQAIFNAFFSPDSRFVVADGADGVVRVLDRRSNKVTEFRGHSDVVRGAWFAPSGVEFVTLSFDGTARVWDPNDPSRSRVLVGHQGVVWDVCYFDATTLVTAGADGRLLAWRPDATSRELIRIRESFLSLECLPALEAVVAATSAGRLYIVSPSGTHEVADEHTPIAILKAGRDGRTFVTGTSDGTVRLYAGGTGERLATSGRVVLRAHGPIQHLALAELKDSSLLAVASEDGRVYLRTLGGPRSLPWQEVSLPARSVAFSPDGTLLAITCNDGGVWFYSFSRHSWKFTSSHQTDVLSGRFSPDGKYFVSSDGAGVVVLHDISRFEGRARNRQGDLR